MRVERGADSVRADTVLSEWSEWRGNPPVARRCAKLIQSPAGLKEAENEVHECRGIARAVNVRLRLIVLLELECIYGLCASLLIERHPGVT